MENQSVNYQDNDVYIEGPNVEISQSIIKIMKFAFYQIKLTKSKRSYFSLKILIYVTPLIYN